MIELEGGTIESVAPVEAIGRVVGIVIDDGPTVPTDVVQAAQGASVELVRNVGDGTAIALSTPSGMQTTPTTDRGASIARIAGMTAGAPDVVPLHRLVLDAAERLAATAWPDRHLVLVLGRPINEAPTLQELAEIAAGADMRLHVIADPGIDTGAAANLAEETGGVASGGQTMLAELDQVTAAIAHRVRVTATVTDPGPHELVLTLDGSRFVTEVDVPAPAAASSSTPTTADVVGPARLGGVRSGAGADHRRHGARSTAHGCRGGVDRIGVGSSRVAVLDRGRADGGRRDGTGMAGAERSPQGAAAAGRAGARLRAASRAAGSRPAHGAGDRTGRGAVRRPLLLPDRPSRHRRWRTRPPVRTTTTSRSPTARRPSGAGARSTGPGGRHPGGAHRRTRRRHPSRPRRNRPTGATGWSSTGYG